MKTIQPRLWDKQHIKFRMEGIKVRRMTAEHINALPDYRTKKVIQLIAKTLIEEDGIMLTKLLKVFIEEYIKYFRVIWKFWTGNETYETFTNHKGEVIECKPILTGKPLELLKLIRDTSTIINMQLPKFKKFEDFKYIREEPANNIVHLVQHNRNVEISGFNVSGVNLINNSKAHKDREPYWTDEEREFIHKTNVIHDTIKCEEMNAIDVILSSIAYVLRQCQHNKYVSEIGNQLAIAHTAFRDYVFNEILQIDTYNEIKYGSGIKKEKTKTEEEELRERYYVENN